MEIPDLVAAVSAVKAQKIKRFPNDVNRASSIGYAVPELEGCLRRGVYERTHWQQKKLHDIRAQFIFDEGHYQEQQVWRDMAEAGIIIIHQSTSFTIYDKRPGKEERILLRGTIDGKVQISEEAGHAKDSLTLEVKSMNPMIYAKMNTFEDFRNKPWTLAYMAQIMSYMLGEKEEQAMFILKDKSNGIWKQLLVPLDMVLANNVLDTAMEINDHVDAGTLPDRVKNIDKCKKCDFNEVCLPDVNWDVGPGVADDPDLENKIDQYLLPRDMHGTMEEIKKEAEKLYKESIAPKLKRSAEGGSLSVICGKYHLSGKTDGRGTFRGKIKLMSEA